MTARVLRGDRWAAELQRQLPEQPVDQWLANQGHLLKQDRHSLVALAELGQLKCYLKFYRPKSILQRLAFRLGQGRAVKAFDNACLLAASGIAVPAPLACLEVDGGLLLATEGMADARDLKHRWQAGEAITAQLAAAADALAKLHRAGFAHGDCKWSNLLCGDSQCYLVDLEAVRACRPRTATQWRDLARFTLNAEDLALPAVDYQDFLAAYCRSVEVSCEQVIAAMQVPLASLRRRHRHKYGERGARLV